jgi:hypothetical protein
MYTDKTEKRYAYLLPVFFPHKKPADTLISMIQINTLCINSKIGLTLPSFNVSPPRSLIPIQSKWAKAFS